MATLECTDKGDKYLYVMLQGLQTNYNGLRYAKYSAKDEYGNVRSATSDNILVGSSHGGTTQILNLTPGTYYSLSAEIRDFTTDALLATVDESLGYGATTYPTKPVVDFEAGENYVDLTIRTEGNVYGYYYWLRDGLSRIREDTVIMTGGGDYTLRLSGLTPNTTYTFSVYGFVMVDGAKYYDDKYTAVISFDTEKEHGFTVSEWSVTPAGGNRATVQVTGTNLRSCSYEISVYVDGAWWQKAEGVIGSSGSTGFSVDITFDNPGTYDVRLTIQSQKKWEDVKEVTIKEGGGDRPADFEWDTPKVSGIRYSLTAKEWNALMGKINEFRQYRSLADYVFFPQTVISGQEFTADIYNQAHDALYDIAKITTGRVNSKDKVTAYLLNVFPDTIKTIQ